MKEELIRIENGIFLYSSKIYRYDLDVSKGECIGVFVDDHEYGGTAYEGIFSGQTEFRGGKAFAYGQRVSLDDMKLWISRNIVRINRYCFTSKETTVRDFLLCLGPGMSRYERKLLTVRLESSEADTLKDQMRLCFTGKEKLIDLTVTEYYKLAVFRAWLLKYNVMILDRISELLPSQELNSFMNCVQLLQSRGIGCIMLEMNEEFMFQYASRIDVIQNRKVCYRLDPEDYGENLFKILGWEYFHNEKEDKARGVFLQKELILNVENLSFSEKEPINFSIGKGEIVLFRDEHLELSPLLKECLFENRRWNSGQIQINGNNCSYRELKRMIGKQVCIQTELPDRDEGILFENLSGLENLFDSLIPKTGSKFIRKKLL